MRRLILLRHAKTETDAPSGRDRDRRLDDRGRSDAAGIGGWLAAQRLIPDAVLVSDAVRARQTWDIVEPALKGKPRPSHLSELYGAGPSQLLRSIRDAGAQPAVLMLVGHNPGLQELALSLIGRDDKPGRDALTANLPTSGVVVIDFAIDHWGDVAFGGGRLTQLVSPKTLRADSSG